MSKIALELLQATGLLKPDGSIVNVSQIPQEELSGILSYYHTRRRELADNELNSLAKSNGIMHLTQS